ncbi:MAG: glycosyltransferase family 2 protein [Verrucomicrobiae bacterium]|nr:glycosyltransferase family 2 protein [Verrucomicrobiae bacterium]
MQLSIIIVNWKSKEYLQKCIASILALTHDLDYEVIVIDAASYDGCGEMLSEAYPQVRFIQGQANGGFAKSNNSAFRASQGDALLFLNPDTELCGRAINLMYEQLLSLPQSGAIGCRLLNSDGTLQASCIQSFPTLVNQLLNAELIRRWFPRSPLWGMAPLFSDSVSPSEVDVVSGACLMMRRKVFAEVGGFSTEYFMYSEDVDLCFKVRQASYVNYYVPTARVIHHGGRSTAESGVNLFSSVMMLESRWRFFLKTRPAWYCWLYRAGMFVISLVRVVLALLIRAVESLRNKETSWNATVAKWGGRFRWALGLEDWVKDY